MNFKNKRKFERINSLNLSYVVVDAKEDDAEKQIMGRTLDVSEAGIRLETHLSVDIDSHMMVSIGLEEEVVDIKGRVVHSKKNDAGKYELGIEFLDKDAAASETLKSFIEAFREQRGMSDQE